MDVEELKTAELAYAIAFLAKCYPSILTADDDGCGRPGFLVRMRIAHQWVAWRFPMEFMGHFEDLPWAEDGDDLPQPILDVDARGQWMGAYIQESRIGRPQLNPGQISEVLDTALLSMCEGHTYISTACQHSQLVNAAFGRRYMAQQSWLHARCRTTCKFCAQQCSCACHEQNPDARWEQRRSSRDIRTRTGP